VSSRPPDGGRTRKQGFSRETRVAQPENEKKTKNENNEKTDRAVRENPTCLPMPSSSRTAIGASGASTRRPADMLGGGAAAEKTKGYL
jgi:hypothetical protein